MTSDFVTARNLFTETPTCPIFFCKLVQARLCTHPHHKLGVELRHQQHEVPCVTVNDTCKSRFFNASQVGKVAVLSEGLHDVTVTHHLFLALQVTGDTDGFRPRETACQEA